MELKWTLFLFVGALLSCGYCLDWMAGGSFTQENFSTLRAKINAFDRTAANSTYSASAITISDELGTLWAPAWNVVIIFYIDNSNYDAVLYGYGFRGHWFWFNGFQTSKGYVSFIIWKDFNCVRWLTLDQVAAGFLQSTFGSTDTTAITTTIQTGYPGREIDDIWLVAQDIQVKVPTADTATIFQDKLAFTVIAAQSYSARFFGKICVKDYVIIGGIARNTYHMASGKALIMQMRS